MYWSVPIVRPFSEDVTRALKSAMVLGLGSSFPTKNASEKSADLQGRPSEHFIAGVCLLHCVSHTDTVGSTPGAYSINSCDPGALASSSYRSLAMYSKLEFIHELRVPGCKPAAPINAAALSLLLGQSGSRNTSLLATDNSYSSVLLQPNISV